MAGSASRTAEARPGHGFGTLPVFLAGISTILGAVMFLRFGYAVGQVGLLGALAVIVLGHMVTVPTALALSEIATNRKVEGGGEYYIISRSFGLRIGSAIGISLYLSQAVSVSFYCIAFAEAFTPLGPAIESALGVPFDPRIVSIPLVLGLLILMLTKGARIGVKVLYVVVAVLTVSLVSFFFGDPTPEADGVLRWHAHVDEADPFFIVFAICFPAFTGMTAGVGLSGDLARPRRAIPLGTLSATLVGMLVYAAIVWKLSVSATPTELGGDQLVMSRIALWGPIIPIGLACATLSSAIGSILVAPRTLQALAKDGCFPLQLTNRLLARGAGEANEPRIATVVTGALALAVVAVGNVNSVARLISMFFMVTYGALCAISFLEQFAARPSYRPTFRSRWYLSLLGALMCLLLMFQMDPVYAVLAIAAMTALYGLSRFTQARSGGDLAALFLGVMAQATRRMRVRLERAGAARRGEDWRPRTLMVSGTTFTGNPSPRRLIGWLCARYGFGTYLHYIEGRLDPDTFEQSEELQARLVELGEKELAGVFVDTIVSPSMRSALAQSLQIPGVSGMENNSVMFELPAAAPKEAVRAVVEDALFASVAKKNLLILRHGEGGFGERRSIHLWLTWHDARNVTLMVLLAYILLGHRDWRRAEISIFAAFPSGRVEEERRRFQDLIARGRLPISPRNIRFLCADDGPAYRALVEESSAEADLVLEGLTLERLREKGEDLLTRCRSLRNVLHVVAAESVLIE